MHHKELKIKRRTFEKDNGVDYFDISWIPNDVNGAIKNPCNYENILKIINETYPDNVVINPEGFSALSMVQFLYDTHPKYESSVRKVQRGGEFMEKYTSYEILLQLKPYFKENRIM